MSFNFPHLFLTVCNNNGDSKYSNSYRLMKSCHIQSIMLNPLCILSLQKFRERDIFIHKYFLNSKAVPSR